MRSCVDSRSQRTAALTTTARHDGPAGTSPHPQPEPMHPRATAVIGLERPLALGHGNLSLLRVASAFHPHVVSGWTRSPLLSSCVLRANRRGLRLPDRSRIATCGRLFEGTDEISLGQTSPLTRRIVDIRHILHRDVASTKMKSPNVVERLALREKTVSFWQCRFAPGTAADNETRMIHRPRAHSRFTRCVEPRPGGIPTGRQQNDDYCPFTPQVVDNFVDSLSRSIGRLWIDRKGVVVF